jgi:hypothetical protein
MRPGLVLGLLILAPTAHGNPRLVSNHTAGAKENHMQMSTLSLFLEGSRSDCRATTERRVRFNGRIRVPEGADPRTLATDRPRHCGDAIRFTLHRLARPWLEEPVSLNYDFQSRLCSGKETWGDNLKAMTKSSWIEVADNGAYIVGARSKRYRLGQSLRGRKLIPYTITDPRVIDFLTRHEVERPEREGWAPIHYELERQLDRISVDTARISADVMASPNAECATEAIGCRNFSCVVCDFGRFHSIVTAMRKELRRCLLIDGQSTNEVDITACQCVIVGWLACLDATGIVPANEQARSGTGKLKKARRAKIIAPHPTLPARPTGITTILSPLISRFAYGSSGWIDGVPSDLRDFVEASRDGSIYELIAGLWGIPTPMSPEARREVKGRVFRSVLFGRIPNEHFDNYEDFRAIAGRFPSLVDYLCKMKLDTRDHGVVARQAQRVESGLMIGQVCWRFLAENPGRGLATVHDWVVVNRPLAESARRIIADEFGAIGMHLTVKIK